MHYYIQDLFTNFTWVKLAWAAGICAVIWHIPEVIAITFGVIEDYIYPTYKKYRFKAAMFLLVIFLAISSLFIYGSLRTKEGELLQQPQDIEKFYISPETRSNSA